jgi:hypothetical protein
MTTELSLADRRAGAKVDACCRVLGWPVAERRCDGIGLFLAGDALAPRRLVEIGWQAGVITAGSPSLAVFEEVRAVPAGYPAFLLQRNARSLAAWAAWVEDGRVLFVCQCRMIAAELMPAGFARLCRAVVQEAVAVDALLQLKGLLAVPGKGVARE